MSIDAQAALARLTVIRDNFTKGGIVVGVDEVHAILAHADAQEAEIERLTVERDDLRRQLDEARAERDAMAKDAARYRFLSCKGVPPHSHRWSRWRLEYWNGEWWDPLMKEELDAAIDAQIEKEKANGSR